MNMPPCMVRLREFRRPIEPPKSHTSQDFLARLAGFFAGFAVALAAVLAFGFPEKIRSQPETNFFEVPVWTV